MTVSHLEEVAYAEKEILELGNAIARQAVRLGLPTFRGLKAFFHSVQDGIGFRGQADRSVAERV